jgi:hypothetical protein
MPVSTGRVRRRRISARVSMWCVVVVALTSSCGSESSDGPPSSAASNRALEQMAVALEAQDRLLALACSPDSVEHSAWTAEEQAVISPTIADAVSDLMRDEVWRSHELPGGSRHALVDQMMEIGRGKTVPVLIDDEVRVLLDVEARHDGYTVSGSARCR